MIIAYCKFNFKQCYLIKSKMELLRFLIIIQKIIFLLVILAFIPVTVVVFSPTMHNISDQAEAAYQNLYNQINSGFVIQKPAGINCSNDFLTRANQYCLQYCIMSQTCTIIGSGQACYIGTQQFTLNGYKYCSNNNILNTVSFTSSSNYSIMSHSNLVPPLFNISSQLSSDLIYFIYNGKKKECLQTTHKIGSSIKKYDEILYNQYSSSLVNQFYPFLTIYLIVFVGLLIDICSKYNLRHFVVIGMCTLCIMEASLSLLGIIFKITSNFFQEDLQQLASSCLISGAYSTSTNNYLQIGSQNGINMSFIIFLTFICFVLLISIVGLTTIAFFQYKAGKAKHQASSGYQLQPF